MALASQVLGGRHAVWLYSAQSAQGTPVTPATPIGLGTGTITSQSGQKVLRRLGSFDPAFIKPGGASGAFDGRVAVQNKGFLLACCQRDAAGELPFFTLALGYRDDAGTPTKWALQLQDCKIHQFDLSLESGDGSGLLELNFSGVGGLASEPTTLVPAGATEAPLAEYEGVLTRGGANHWSKGFRLTVNHNVAVKWIIAGATRATFKRGWTYQREGQQAVDGEVTRYVKSGLNMQADTLSGSDLVLALSDIGGGGNSLSITAVGAQYGSEKINPEVEGDITYSLPFDATGVTLA